MKMTYSVLIAAFFTSSIYAMEREKQSEKAQVPRVKCMLTYTTKMTLYNTTLALYEHNDKLIGKIEKNPSEFASTFFVKK